MANITKLIRSANPEQTMFLAAAVGQQLKGSEVIELRSDMGGGKTTFVRGLAKGIKSEDHVASPTFTISREYRAGSLTLYHFDFYRLNDPGIMVNELAEIINDPLAIIVVEWAGIVENVLPAKRLIVTLQATDDMSRNFTFEYPESLQYLLQAIA
jgi:tRNA threonylcarbamoyladenosine biosynthesis protein TsaE